MRLWRPAGSPPVAGKAGLTGRDGLKGWLPGGCDRREGNPCVGWCTNVCQEEGLLARSGNGIAGCAGRNGTLGRRGSCQARRKEGRAPGGMRWPSLPCSARDGVALRHKGLSFLLEFTPKASRL